jgi:cytochrome c oxidase subunit 1
MALALDSIDAYAGPAPRPRPGIKTGLISWLTTVDHKRIAILYGVTALVLFMVGGFEALLIRTQLAFPGNNVVSAQHFNELFTMHGTTMIFLVVMPMGVAFFNFLIPLMIGARDVAFPRLNAFSYWVFLGGAILINTGWLVDAAPNAGWFGYANITSKEFNPGLNVDFWVLGLQVLGVASVAGALNFIVTIINMRAPGMTMMRMPVFVWMTLVTSFLLILAFPVITIALVELTFDRMAGTNFFHVAKGGLPILWQHLFWVFGHPEVYILILPAMGIVSEILPTFSRKPLFGYPVVVFSGVAIGFMGFTVWSHHMFTTGLGPIANAAFSLTTMAIAVPTGVKIFNWVGTLWGGQVRFRVPLFYAIGFISMFMMGGFSGLMHASPPADAQQQDTYFVVAHFHYVLIGGSLMALFGGIYYWLPKIYGRMPRENWGRLGFFTLLIGFNITFFPMHWLGLDGMPRRIYTYSAEMGWNHLNLVCTIGAYIMLCAFLIIFHDIVWTVRHGAPAGPDPWNARTLEWMIPSPPPEYNFDVIPVVHARDELWYRKYPHLHEHEGEAPAEAREAPVSGPDEDEHGHEEGGHGGGHEHGIHMPGLSWYPLLTALGFVVAAYGLLGTQVWGWTSGWIAIIGVLFMVANIYFWGLEGIGGYEVYPAGTESSAH